MKGRKGLVSHAGGCQGCLPKGTHISSLSQIRNEQKFSSVHSGRRPDIKWRPWLSKQAPCYYVYLRLHMGFHSCFYWGLRGPLCKSNTDRVLLKKTGTWNDHSRHLSPNTKPTFQMFEDRIWNVKISLHVEGSRITRRLRLKRTKSKQLSAMSEKYLSPSPQSNSTLFLTVWESLVQVDVLSLTSAWVWNMAAVCRQVCVHTVPCSSVIPVQAALKRDTDLQQWHQTRHETI